MGDLLLSSDATGSKPSTVKVVGLRRAEDDLLKIEYESGTLLCSTTHPLMLRRGDLLAEASASRLAPGDLLVLEDLSSTAIISVEPAGQGPVIMITTEADHLYFAGDAPVLGHNIPASKSATTVNMNAILSGTGTGSA